MEQKAKLTILIITTFATVSLLLPPRTAALVPYTRPAFDLLDDPFKILEHSPFAADRATADDAVALARADWRETPAEHQISLDVPGMKREDVKIEVDEDSRVVRVTGERRTEEEVQDERWHRAERTVGKFWRRFRLPADAEVGKVAARLEDGVLRIRVPKVDGGKGKEKEGYKVVDIESGEKEKINGGSTKTEL